MIRQSFKKFFFLFLLFLFFAPCLVSADLNDGNEDFFVEEKYDWYSREKISARLRNVSNKAYFYIDNQWWEDLSFEDKKQTIESLNVLAKELRYVIYPVLSSEYGLEWSPGIDDDKRITVLIHPMVKDAEGYFRSVDEYVKSQAPNSNQREMVYINAFEISSEIAPSLLAHELTHLITFNQKNVNFKVEEEIWLNEARAEYAPTLCGYNDYKNDYLESRIETFLSKPSDSITEWTNSLADYGALNLFVHYAVEKYGLEILTDSLHSSKIGVESINEALRKNNYQEDFSQIFRDWTITVFVNDCNLGKKYCYSNSNFSKIHINPSMNFLPVKGESSLEINRQIKAWSGNWLKFIGGKASIKIEFIGSPANSFEVPYIIKDTSGDNSLYFFDLDENQKGKITISDFGSESSSVIVIPSVFETDPSAYFFCSIATLSEEAPNDSNFLDKSIEEMTEQEIRFKIKELEDVLSLLKTWLEKIVSAREKIEEPEITCQNFSNDLYYGLENNQVRCLQDFLKSLGSDIYPEGLVTGFFGNLTQRAVVRFQEKFASEILNPLNLTNGTGYVGNATRSKLNNLLFGN